jgi:pimeloyl-ACP methyl ester carboxylesterase
MTQKRNSELVKYVGGRASIVLGHAYGHFIARILATKYPSRVRGVVLAASHTKQPSPLMAIAPFLAANLTLPEEERSAVLQGAFFASGHDARPWREGWYPKTLAMQRARVHGLNAGPQPPLQQRLRMQGTDVGDPE